MKVQMDNEILVLHIDIRVAHLLEVNHLYIDICQACQAWNAQPTLAYVCLELYEGLQCVFCGQAT